MPIQRCKHNIIFILYYYKTVLEKIETIIPEVLKDRNLFVNESKTEKYTISRNSPNEWKDCKLVGSKLETVNDIENRKNL